jgi:hypothetical protein
MKQSLSVMHQSFHGMLKSCTGGEEIGAFYFLGLVWSISMSGHRPGTKKGAGVFSHDAGGWAWRIFYRNRRDSVKKRLPTPFFLFLSYLSRFSNQINQTD